MCLLHLKLENTTILRRTLDGVATLTRLSEFRHRTHVNANRNANAKPERRIE